MTKKDSGKHQRFIDTVIGTLYARSARGYSLTDKVIDADAVKLLSDQIEKIDKTHRKEFQDEAEYRLEQFKEFFKGSKELKDEVIKLAREKHISLEEAYELASKK